MFFLSETSLPRSVKRLAAAHLQNQPFQSMSMSRLGPPSDSAELSFAASSGGTRRRNWSSA